MTEFGGWQFPAGEQHLIAHMRRANLPVDGRLSYQYHKIVMALAHVRDWRCAVDIGGHVGLWAIHLAKRFEIVEAFEPMPAHADCFIENIEAPNVTLHRCALGASAGEVRLARYQGNSGHSHVDPTGKGEIVAKMRTLDSFDLPDVGFIKIDCEGYEREILAGAVETLERCRPVLIVEQKSGFGQRFGYGEHAGLDLLREMGARVVAKKAGDFVLVW